MLFIGTGLNNWPATCITQEQLDDLVVRPTWHDITDRVLGNLPSCDVVATDEQVAQYRRDCQVADGRASELFNANLPDCYRLYNERGYYILNSQLFPRLYYAVKSHLSGCYVAVYDRLRKPQAEYTSALNYKMGWMCIAQEVYLPEGDKLLQVGLMLRDHEKSVLKTAFWCGSSWTKSPLHHIKRYMDGRKHKR